MPMFRLFVGQKFVDHGSTGTTYPANPSASSTSAVVVRRQVLRAIAASSISASTRRAAVSSRFMVSAAASVARVASTAKMLATSTVSTSTALFKAAGKFPAMSVSAAASASRSILKQFSVSASSSYSILKSTSYSIIATCASSVSHAGLKAKGLAISIGVSTASLLGPRSITKFVSSSVLATMTAVKSVAKSFSSTVASSSSAASAKLRLLVLSVSSSVSTASQRSVQKSMTAISSSTSSLMKATSKMISSSVSTSASITKRSIKATQNAVLSTISISKSIGKLTLSAISSSVQLAKLAMRSISITVSRSVSSVKSVAISYAASTSSAVSSLSTKVKLVFVSVGSFTSSTGSRLIGKVSALSSATAASKFVSVGKRSAPIVTSSVSFLRGLTKGLFVQASSASFARKSVSTALVSAVSSTASVLKRALTSSFAVATSASWLSRSVGKMTYPAATAGVQSFRSISTSIVNSSTAAVNVLRSKALLAFINVGALASAGLTRLVSKRSEISAGTVAQLTRSVSKSVAQSLASTGSAVRLVSTLSNVQSAANVAVGLIKRKLLTVSVGATASVVFARETSKRLYVNASHLTQMGLLKGFVLYLNVEASITSYLGRGISKFVAGSAQAGVGAIRGVSHILDVASYATTSMSRSVAYVRTMDAFVDTSSSVKKIAGKMVQDVGILTSTMAAAGRYYMLNFAISVASTTYVQRAVQKFVDVRSGVTSAILAAAYLFTKSAIILISKLKRVREIVANVRDRSLLNTKHRIRMVPNMYVSRDFSDAEASESEPYGFDFTKDVPVADTITGAEFTLVVVTGTDADAATRLIGSPVISEKKVSQRVEGLQAGVRYKLKCVATTSTGNKVSLFSYVKCVG